LRSFLASGVNYTGGVFVGGGKVTNDSVADIVTGADSGVGPHVKVFDGATGAEVRSFFAYSPSFTGGVRVAAGDVTGDGLADVITGTGPGAAHVKVFDGTTGQEIRSFLPYGGFTGGVFVAAGDVNNDGKADVITGTDTGAGPHVKAFDGANGQELRSFFAYGLGFMGGVRVGSAHVDGDAFADIITGDGESGGGVVKVFSGSSGQEIASFLAFGPRHDDGVYVAGATLVPEPGGAALCAVFACGAVGLCVTRRTARMR
jgi:hypothetical protein